MESSKITVSVNINATIEKVWDFYKGPEHNIIWNTGHPDWHTPISEIDLSVGGKFRHHMAAKDGSMAFDFIGEYYEVIPHSTIKYKMEDGRDCLVSFEAVGDSIEVTEIFEAESQNSVELQKSGWQGILNNFKSYCENN